MTTIVNLKITFNKTRKLSHAMVLVVIALTFDTTTFAQSGTSKNGDDQVTISGELEQWHDVTLNLAGPFCNETDMDPNPFANLFFSVTFEHESGTPNIGCPVMKDSALPQ